MEMTLAQALADGYEFCGIEGAEFQVLQYITDLDEEDFQDDHWRLFSKETVSPVINKEDVIDRAVDEAYDSLEFHVDTSDIRDTVRAAVDWDSIVAKINDDLAGHAFHKLTDIKLIR